MARECCDTQRPLLVADSNSFVLNLLVTRCGSKKRGGGSTAQTGGSAGSVGHAECHHRRAKHHRHPGQHDVLISPSAPPTPRKRTSTLGSLLWCPHTATVRLQVDTSCVWLAPDRPPPVFEDSRILRRFEGLVFGLSRYSLESWTSRGPLAIFPPDDATSPRLVMFQTSNTAQRLLAAVSGSQDSSRSTL